MRVRPKVSNSIVITVRTGHAPSRFLRDSIHSPMNLQGRKARQTKGSEVVANRDGASNVHQPSRQRR